MKNTRKSRKMHKLLAMVSCALLLVAISVGATVAYLTSQDAVTNTFTVGNVQIKLNETDTDNDTNTNDNEIYTNEDGTAYSRDKANAYKLLPGLEYDKDPMVTVLANSEDCFVRCIVTLTKGDAIYALPSEYKIKDCFNIGDKWEYKSEKYDADAKTYTYEFWYKEEVKASAQNRELQDLFTTITMPDGITNAELATLDGMQINVVAHAIQADGFANPDAAWEAWGE